MSFFSHHRDCTLVSVTVLYVQCSPTTPAMPNHGSLLFLINEVERPLSRHQVFRCIQGTALIKVLHASQESRKKLHSPPPLPRRSEVSQDNKFVQTKPCSLIPS